MPPPPLAFAAFRRFLSYCPIGRGPKFLAFPPIIVEGRAPYLLRDGAATGWHVSPAAATPANSPLLETVEISHVVDVSLLWYFHPSRES
ncbi:MAG: hypothetical protein JW999_11470 [Methanotrichaceae archaeon]|nr:hypothetical protein [Methanotrichaceae archaeon]